MPSSWKGLQLRPERRFSTAAAMADALEAVVRPAPPEAVAAWVNLLAKDELAKRTGLVREAPCVYSPGGGVSRARRRAVWLGVAGAATGLVTAGAVALAASGTRVPTPAPTLAARTPPSITAAIPLVESTTPENAAPATYESHRDSEAASLATRAPTPPPIRSAARAPSNDCSPPYTRDAHGRKLYKVHCLGR